MLTASRAVAAGTQFFFLVGTSASTALALAIRILLLCYCFTTAALLLLYCADERSAKRVKAVKLKHVGALTKPLFATELKHVRALTKPLFAIDSRWRFE
jgi:hypothetical protein